MQRGDTNMQNRHFGLVPLIREIGYAVIGVLKIPLIVIGYILGLPVALLAFASDFGRNGRGRSGDNYFMNLLEKLWRIR